MVYRSKGGKENVNNMENILNQISYIIYPLYIISRQSFTNIKKYLKSMTLSVINN